MSLEKIRFEERLEVEWRIDDDLLNVQIPPFTLQMLVENAVKHGISELMEGGVIRTSVRQDDNHTILEVQNSGVLKSKVDLGVGLQNIKKRLQLQYGNAARFSLREAEGMVVAQVLFDNERV